MKTERKQASGSRGSPVDFVRIEKGFNSLAEDAEQIAFEQLLDQLNVEFVAAKPIHDLDELSDVEVAALYEEQRRNRLLQRLEATRKYIKGVTRASRAGSAVNRMGLKLLKLLDQIEKGCGGALTEFRTVSFTFVQLCRAESEKPAETEQENKDVKDRQEGFLEPKPPEFLQKLLWIMKYGRRHWKLVLLALLILLILSYLGFA